MVGRAYEPRRDKIYLRHGCFHSNLGRAIQKLSMTIKQIRHIIWLRQAGRCLDCDKFVTEKQAHMHELVFRSKGGKISLTNSVILCSMCHLNAPQNHGNRRPQFRGGK